jgi:hypothetical protein
VGAGKSGLTVLRHAGLPIDLFEQERILLTTEEMFVLYRAIYEVSSDPAIGLKLGTEERMERYDPCGVPSGVNALGRRTYCLDYSAAGNNNSFPSGSTILITS